MNRFINNLILRIMGLIRGIDNDMIGTLGNHVGRKVRGKNILSMKPGKRTKPATANQLAHQEKVGILFVMFGFLADFVGIGFSGFKTKMTAVNAAVSYNYKFITGVAGDYELDYPMLTFGRGKVAAPEQAVVAPVVGRKLTFTWLAGLATVKNNLPTDLSYFLVYSKVLDKFFTVEGAVPRSALTYTLQLPFIFAGEEVHVYMMFASVLGKPGNSVYLGAVEVV